MPLVHVLYRPNTVTDDVLRGLRDAIRACVAAELARSDPDHEVTDAMVDVTLQPIGPLDIVGPAMLITVLARHEEARAASADAIVAGVERVALDAGAPPGSMVELVLNQRWSGYAYPEA